MPMQSRASESAYQARKGLNLKQDIFFRACPSRSGTQLMLLPVYALGTIEYAIAGRHSGDTEVESFEEAARSTLFNDALR